MDLYFIVGELEFPAGVAARWRASELPATAKRRQVTRRSARGRPQAGAGGQWYSGDHVAGRHTVLPNAAKRVTLHTLKDVSAWAAEAAALGEDPPSGASAKPKKSAKNGAKKSAPKNAKKGG